MSIRRQSELLAERLDAVATFRHSYERLVAMTESVEDLPGYMGARRRITLGREQQYGVLRAEANPQAGAAIQALSGELVMIEHYGRRYDPVVNWADSLEPEGGLASVDQVRDALATAEGRLAQQLRVARGNEATWAFRIGWFFSLPRRASAAAGGGGVGRVAFASTMVGQIVAGLLVAALLAALSWALATLL